MALKVYKFEQPELSSKAAPSTLLTAEEIDKPAKGVLTGIAIMMPFYLIVGVIVALLKRL